GAVLVGKWGARWIIGLLQIAFALVAGSVLFGIRWGENLPMVVLVLAAYASLAACLGVLLGNFSRTQGQAAAFGAVCANLLSALGGCWWPMEFYPEWGQKLVKVVPTGLAMDALHQLVNFGAPAAAVFPHVAVFVGLSIGLGVLIARRFRFE